MELPMDKIERLAREMEDAKKQLVNCSHKFGEPFYNPEKYQEGYGSVQDGAGSDPHWSYAGYTEKTRPKWTRSCTKCGYREHTYKQEPVITGYRPAF